MGFLQGACDPRRHLGEDDRINGTRSGVEKGGKPLGATLLVRAKSGICLLIQDQNFELMEITNRHTDTHTFR